MKWSEVVKAKSIGGSVLGCLPLRIQAFMPNGGGDLVLKPIKVSSLWVEPLSY